MIPKKCIGQIEKICYIFDMEITTTTLEMLRLFAYAGGLGVSILLFAVILGRVIILAVGSWWT